ncbi:MAG TPA: FAD-dependent oxidoreductase, partial [Dehalococcoidales bacterium]|nr:FAD-dependent oxidoreductase [Dehalococcoidales bacterium]
LSIASFAEISEAVHALGSKIFVQLTAGFGRVGFHGMGGPPVSASAVPFYLDPSITCRALETKEVDELVESFGPAAEIMKAAGVDGVELHGHEGYLFDQFTTAIWNRRKDKYGGDLQGRLTFPIDILNVIKAHAGKDFAVQYRVGIKHYMKALNSGALPGETFKEAGRDIEEGLEMARLLEQAGFDSLHVDAGCYDSWYWAHPPTYQEHGCMVDMAELTKKVVKIPVIAVGRIDIPELAEKVVAEGKADMVAIGRGLLADAYWPAKAAAGKAEDIRPCIGCHDGCIWRFSQGRPLSCAVNPSCGREKEYALTPTSRPQKIVVAGGGVAGMEAARAAAARGHKVVVYEKSNVSGGHLNEASVPAFKHDIARLMEWYKTQLKELGVVVKLGTLVTKALLAKEKPDTVILATGSQSAIPKIPGVENAVTCEDVLLGKKKTGKSVIVLGGGLVGCETALWLALKKKDVTIIEMLPELMSAGISVPRMNRYMLRDMLALNKIKITIGARAVEISKNGVVVSIGGKKKSIKADTVVLAVGLKPENSLASQLNGSYQKVFTIGDCREPRNIMGAIWDGYEVGRSV